MEMEGHRHTTPHHAADGLRRIQLCGEELPHPGHVCAFFDSRAQKYAVLAPFLKDAIEVGDRIINIVDEAARDDHVSTLTASGVPITPAIERGQYRLSTAEETYLQTGLVNLDFMLDLLSETLTSARARGECVRTCGEMNWIGRTRLPVQDVLAYEARVNELAPSFQCTLLCVYDMAETPSSLISDILSTHPYAIIQGRLRKNPYYVQPEEYLKMLADRRPN